MNLAISRIKQEKFAFSRKCLFFVKHALQDSGDLATDFSFAKSKKSVSKSFSDGFATEKNSVGKTLVAKLCDGNLQSVAKFSDGF